MEDKNKQFNINAKDPEAGIVTKMMLSDGMLNRSEFFRLLIRKEWIRRQDEKAESVKKAARQRQSKIH